MARHMHKDVLAIFAQGQIQGEAKKIGYRGGWGGGGVPFFKKLLQTWRLQQQTEFIAVM